MADRSTIEWTEATWNPMRGCSRVSDGCKHCYAERVAARFAGPGMPYEGLIHPSTRGWNGTVRLVPEALDQPLRWKRPRRIFVNSMSDLFHESVPPSVIAAIFAVMASAPQHTFQVLTKRPERAWFWFDWMLTQTRDKLHECLKGAMGYHHPRRPAINGIPWPLPNVWLGVSVENQAAADKRIPLLLQCPAAVRWLSCEPLLGPIDFFASSGVWSELGYEPWLNRPILGDVHWLVAGGESGPGARPMHPDWARTLRDQCAAAGVPFFFKQWGEWSPIDSWEPWDRTRQIGIRPNGGRAADDEWHDDWHRLKRIGKRAAGRLLDGVEHNGYPEVSP